MSGGSGGPSRQGYVKEINKKGGVSFLEVVSEVGVGRRMDRKVQYIWVTDGFTEKKSSQGTL